MDPAHVRTSTTVAGDKSVVGGKSMARSPSLCFQGLLSHDRRQQPGVAVSGPWAVGTRRSRFGNAHAAFGRGPHWPRSILCAIWENKKPAGHLRRSGFSSGGVGCSEEDLRVASVVWNEKWGLLRSDRGSMRKHRSQQGLFVLWLLSFVSSRKGLPSDWAREGLPMGWGGR